MSNYYKNIIKKNLTQDPSAIQGGYDTNKNPIVFVPQAHPSQLGLYGTAGQAILGHPLIPVVAAERPMSYSVKNQEIVNLIHMFKIDEVMKQKMRENRLDINNLYKNSKVKCDLHPNSLSDKCRYEI